MTKSKTQQLKDEIDRSDIARMKGIEKEHIETAMKLSRQDTLNEVLEIINNETYKYQKSENMDAELCLIYLKKQIEEKLKC